MRLELGEKDKEPTIWSQGWNLMEYQEKQKLWRKGMRILKLVENDQTGSYETNRVGGQEDQGCRGYEEEGHERQGQRL